MKKRPTIKVTVHRENRSDDELTLIGRPAWELVQLIKAGEDGVTPISHPAPRHSEYVRVLRKSGLVVETLHEPHKGQFPGTHGRYVLRSRVTAEGDPVLEWSGRYRISGGVPPQAQEAAA